MAKNEEEKDEWLFKTCFKLAADEDAPLAARICGPLVGTGLLVAEPIARLCFRWHEKDDK